MSYVALFIGLILLLALYFSSKWEEKQYEDIDDAIEETDEETKQIERDDVLEEPGKLWEGEIDGVETKISKGWQRQIYVIISQDFNFEARIERTNYLRSITRFFKELTSPRMNVHSTEADQNLLAYSTHPEPAKQILMAWSHPEIIQILQEFHHVEIDDEEFVVMFYHPEINLEEITQKAGKAVRLFKALPESIKTESGDSVEQAT